MEVEFLCMCLCVYAYACDFQVKQQLEIWAVILLTRVLAGTSHMAVRYGL